MRLLSLALLGLIFASAPLLWAEAAERPRSGQHRTQVRSATHQVAAQRRPVVQAMVHRSAPLRGQLAVARDQRAASSANGCSPRRGAARCTPARMTWTHGLPPAAGTQANECPDGTMATLARGHDDIVRCMPI